MSKCRLCLEGPVVREALAIRLAMLEPEEAGEQIREAPLETACPEVKLELARRVMRHQAGPQDSQTRISAPTLH